MVGYATVYIYDGTCVFRWFLIGMSMRIWFRYIYPELSKELTKVILS